MNKILFALIFVLLASCKSEQVDENYNLGVIPKPLVSEQLKGTFTLSKAVVIKTNSSKKEVLFTANYLQEKIHVFTELDLQVRSDLNSIGRTITLLEKNIGGESEKEAYQLDITEDAIVIIGEDVGLFYGVQTLLQMIENNRIDKTTIALPTCKIKDAPRFNWRGMHLDESRHFFGIDEVKKYIDLLAMYKLNTFHWHLTDDQGWRIEIKSRPKLTEIAAWREGTGKEIWTYFVKPATEGKPKYGGYYTQEEIREVIKYAEERFITVVPEIELPAHSWAALVAYPELSCSGEVWQKPSDVAFEFSDPFCAGNEETFQFFDDVLTEVIDLFPSEYIHIGGDEAKKTPWEHCTKCQGIVKQENLSNVEELQSYFIKRIERMVTSKGRKIIGWEEIMEGGLPKEAVVMSWLGTESGIEASSMGYKTIMAPNQFMYMDKSQDIDQTNKIGVLTLQDVYDYNPVPNTLDEKIGNNIIGVHGALWSEYVYSNAILERQLLPRLTALSEVAWASNENKNWKDYLARLENQFPLWDDLGVNYYIQSPEGLKKDIYTGDHKKVVLSSPYKNATIKYTLDGSEPTLNSAEYTQAFLVTDKDTIKAKTFLPSGKSSKTSVGNYKQSKFLEPKSIKGLKSGLNLKVSLGNISTLNNLSSLKFRNKLIVDKVEVPNDSTLIDDYGLEFTGYINIREDGIYTFSTSSDDGSRVLINDQLVVDNDGIHGMITKSGKVALRKGKHAILVQFFQGNYGASVKVEMKNETDDLKELTEFFIEK